MPIADICCTVSGLFKMGAHEVFEGSGAGLFAATVKRGAVASFGFGLDAIPLAYWPPGWLLHFGFWRASGEEVEQAED